MRRGKIEGDGNKEKGWKIRPTVELRRLLHGDLLSVGKAARQGRVILKRRIAGIKKPSVFRRIRRRRQDGPTGAEETPLPSGLWRDRCPWPHGPGT